MPLRDRRRVLVYGPVYADMVALKKGQESLLSKVGELECRVVVMEGIQHEIRRILFGIRKDTQEIIHMWDLPPLVR